jgi:four helix bundle protein
VGASKAVISITHRTAAFALNIVRCYRDVQSDSVGRILGKQLLRSGTSIGANVEEAQGAQSKRDFITKYSIAHKEARETKYWLHLLRDSQVLSKERVDLLIGELNPILKILTSALITAKSSLERPPHKV